MKETKILSLLNENNNFQLSLKTIQITDNDVLKMLKNKLEEQQKKAIIIDNIDNSYELLLQAYNNNVDYVLINETITFLLPIFIGVTKDCMNIIKPMTPIYYCLKDNRVIQHLKTKCHKNDISFTSVKTNEQLIDAVFNEINNMKR